MTVDKQTQKSELKLGFAGLGHMGFQMTKRLLDAGYQMTVYDRTEAKAQELESSKVRVARSPSELASQCDVVMACVTDDAAQQHIMFGPDGVLAGLQAGATLIDLSTVSPTASRQLYKATSEKGGTMLDAAVSGSVPQVEQGKLVIFVGGEQETYEKCKPILEVLGQSSFYMGSSGMGTTMKLVVNTLLGVGMQALAEAIALGEKAGLQKNLLLDTLEQTAVLTAGQKSKLQNVKRGEYLTEFALSLQHKDLRLILNEADEVMVTMPATAMAFQMYTAAIISGKSADFSVMIEFMRNMAGLKD